MLCPAGGWPWPPAPSRAGTPPSLYEPRTCSLYLWPPHLSGGWGCTCGGSTCRIRRASLTLVPLAWQPQSPQVLLCFSQMPLLFKNRNSLFYTRQQLLWFLKKIIGGRWGGSEKPLLLGRRGLQAVPSVFLAFLLDTGQPWTTLFPPRAVGEPHKEGELM